MPTAKTAGHNPAMAALPLPPATGIVDPDGHLPLWRRMLRHLLGGIVVSLSAGVFFTLVFGDGLWANLVISLCVGGCIQGLIEIGRYAIAGWLRSRGDTSPSVAKNWPGWRWMAPYVLAAALLGYWLGRNLGAIVLGHAWPVHTGGSTRGLVLVLAITVAVSAAATYNFFMRSQVATIAAQAEAARRLAADNQLRLLQSQLEPHMLFNTLANLRVLVTLDPPRAQAMLDHLIRYLRATLGASHATLHPLATEFALLGDYLALMALRMGPRLQVQLDLPDALRQHPVPPLLLQPLVENSIRHGLEPQVAGGRITVQARLQAGQLLLAVRDTGVGLAEAAAPLPAATPPATPADGSHYGTRHVADRLATLYGQRASFQLRPAPDADGGTLAEVRLPLDTPTPA
jgi:signal transduction histidine kinase